MIDNTPPVIKGCDWYGGFEPKCLHDDLKFEPCSVFYCPLLNRNVKDALFEKEHNKLIDGVNR